jgi:membrane-associated phospholipid phosphatase
VTALPAELDAGPRSRHFWLWAAALVLAALSALATQVDLPLARWIKAATAAREIPGDFLRLVQLSEAFAYGGTVALIILAALLLDPRGWRVVPRLAICVYGAGILADIGKLLVGRLRPRHANLDGPLAETFVGWLPSWNLDRLAELGLSPGNNLRSFPSGHTTTAFGLALGLSLLYPRGRWLFLAIAMLAGYQRIDSESHFLSDVLAGAALALFTAALTTGNNTLARWLARLERPCEPKELDRG